MVLKSIQSYNRTLNTPVTFPFAMHLCVQHKNLVSYQWNKFITHRISPCNPTVKQVLSTPAVPHPWKWTLNMPPPVCKFIKDILIFEKSIYITDIINYILLFQYTNLHNTLTIDNWSKLYASMPARDISLFSQCIWSHCSNGLSVNSAINNVNYYWQIKFRL